MTFQSANTAKRLGFPCLAVAIALSVGGCATKSIDDAEEKAREQFLETAADIRASQAMDGRPSRLTETDDVYLVGAVSRISPWDLLPERLKAQVLYDEPGSVAFSEVVSFIADEVGSRVVLTSDALGFLKAYNEDEERDQKQNSASDLLDSAPPLPGDSGKPGDASSLTFAPYTGGASVLASAGRELSFPLHYQGTVAGLLDTVTGKAGLFWEWKGDHVEVFRRRTVNYELDVANVSTSTEAQMSSDRSTDDESGGKSKTKQSVEMVYEPGDLYEDIQETIDSMLNEDGQANLSTSASLLTVSDTPAVQSRVEQYISRLNEKGNRNVAIRVAVYELSMSAEAEYGIDWNMLFSGSDRFSAELSSNFTGESPNLEFQVVNPSSRFVDSVAALAASNNDVNFSTVTNLNGVTKNTQALSLQLADEIGYLKEVEVAPGVDGQNPSFSLTPGTILEGISLSVLPRILSDSSVDLQVTLDISKLNKIDEVRVGEGESQSLIQTPDRSLKDFMSIMNLQNGEPMVMTGLERTEQSSDTTSLFTKAAWALGGKRSGGTRKVMNLIVLTPYLM